MRRVDGVKSTVRRMVSGSSNQPSLLLRKYPFEKTRITLPPKNHQFLVPHIISPENFPNILQNRFITAAAEAHISRNTGDHASKGDLWLMKFPVLVAIPVRSRDSLEVVDIVKALRAVKGSGIGRVGLYRG